MRKLTIAYHRPGMEFEVERLNLLVKVAHKLTGIEKDVVFELKPLDEVSPRDGNCILLMPIRGGHALSLEEKGVKVKTIPLQVTVAAIASRASGYSSIILVYHQPKRVEALALALDSLNHIAEMLRGLGFEIHLLEYGGSLSGAARGSCIVVPLTVCKGRISEWARRLASSIKCSYAGVLLDYGFWLIASWIALEASRSIECI